ncbi:MAG: hypothetical protein ACTSVI_10260 [Promethearchaeota archaeon]
MLTFSLRSKKAEKLADNIAVSVTMLCTLTISLTLFIEMKNLNQFALQFWFVPVTAIILFIFLKTYFRHHVVHEIGLFLRFILIMMYWVPMMTWACIFLDIKYLGTYHSSFILLNFLITFLISFYLARWIYINKTGESRLKVALYFISMDLISFILGLTTSSLLFGIKSIVLNSDEGMMYHFLNGFLTPLMTLVNSLEFTLLYNYAGSHYANESMKKEYFLYLNYIAIFLSILFFLSLTIAIIFKPLLFTISS